MTPLERLTEAVDELTRPRKHREPLTPDQAPWDATEYRWQDTHHKSIHGAVVSHVPSLLAQLEEAVEPSGSVEAGHRIPTSQPAARLDAMDVLLEVDAESTWFTSWFGAQVRETLAETLRQLVGLVAALDEDDPSAKHIARAASSWRVKAAVVTGWEVPAKSLANTCPLCGERGTLRARVDLNNGSGIGYCLSCRADWDEATIGLLAEHLRWENGDEGGAATYRAHRTSVMAAEYDPARGPLLAQMHWVATCSACDWRRVDQLKDSALRAAGAHRKSQTGQEGAA